MMHASLLSFGALFLAIPIATGAQTITQTSVPSAVHFWTENGIGQAHRTWSIDATGAVKISGERCQGCRWHAPYKSTHQLDPERYREIALLLELEMLRNAPAAPCTLPRGDQNTPLENSTVSNGRTGVNDSVRLLTLCVSPEMDLARTQINKAHAIIGALDSAKSRGRTVEP
jgi:hypothetical protein